jgi:hypothetical protein
LCLDERVVDDELDGLVPCQVVGEDADVPAEVALEDLAGLGAERQFEAPLVLSSG